jgi:DNA-3-methyladenine glycosylase II
MITKPDFTYLKKDKKIINIINSIEDIIIEKQKNVFMQLVRSIAGQQLSVKAADSIFQKFLTVLNTKSPKPENILALDIEELRAVGFSYNKGNYIKNIAQFWLDNKLTDKHFEKLSDEEIISFLTQIKGVGVWTVQMLLMFTLARPNLFAIDDLGIQQGMAIIYDWQNEDVKTLKQKMMLKAKDYAPHSTYICLCIWRHKDTMKLKK